MIKQLPQKDFPLLEEYKKVFDITPETIFAYDDTIYCDYGLPNHLIIHEITHHEQQKRYGLEKWVELYLTDVEFRLKMEVEAYRHQISTISDRNNKLRLRLECAKDLSSSLYGNICTYEEALELLKTTYEKVNKFYDMRNKEKALK